MSSNVRLNMLELVIKELSLKSVMNEIISILFLGFDIHRQAPELV